MGTMIRELIETLIDTVRRGDMYGVTGSLVRLGTSPLVKRGTSAGEPVRSSRCQVEAVRSLFR